MAGLMDSADKWINGPVGRPPIQRSVYPIPQPASRMERFMLFQWWNMTERSLPGYGAETLPFVLFLEGL